MKTLLKNTIYSIVTCALVMSLQGCGSDRAGISPDEANNSSGTPSDKSLGTTNVTPDDTDGDGIKDEDETNGYIVPGVGRVTSNPKVWDTDGDGISDGCEIDDSLCNTPKTFKTPTNPVDPDSDDDGIEDGDELLSNVGDAHVTDPSKADTDGDGLGDGDEINAADAPENFVTDVTDPLKKDTDGDMLSDGFEAKISKTKPLDIDSDKDGVTDGIEVCGTKNGTGYGAGEVTATTNGISLNGSNNFYDDLLTGSIINYDNYRGCQTPADTNSDAGGKIDALDPTNDSDGDGRPNDKEKEHDTDPLHSGLKYNSTVQSEVDPEIQAKYYYPWIVNTPEGKELVNKGFVYVPKADSKGYWMAKYEARDNGNNDVKFDDNSTTGHLADISRSDAETKLANSSVVVGGTTIDIKLPASAEYDYLGTVATSASTDSNGCITVKNTVGDTNMPENATGEICELEENDLEELVKSGNNFNCYSDRKADYSSVEGQGPSVSFRGIANFLP